MASATETLPRELLDPILESHPELMALYKSSKDLHRRLESKVYSLEGAPNEVRDCACKYGKTRVIQLVASYGDDVIVVDLYHYLVFGHNIGLTASQEFTLTLLLAAGRNHVEAVRLLLEKELSGSFHFLFMLSRKSSQTSFLALFWNTSK
jgi:hypothetical protein